MISAGVGREADEREDGWRESVERSEDADDRTDDGAAENADERTDDEAAEEDDRADGGRTDPDERGATGGRVTDAREADERADGCRAADECGTGGSAGGWRVVSRFGRRPAPAGAGVRTETGETGDARRLTGGELGPLSR